jgi:fatty acid desaturase
MNEATQANQGTRQTPSAVKDAWWEPDISRAELKALMKRSDAPGLYFLGIWAVLMLVTGDGVYVARESLWIIPAVIAYGFVLGFAYAPSHECAHGTAFKTRWLNDTVLWMTSFVWGESPTHRRFAHSHHHTHTWHWKVDAQMGYSNPVRFSTWFGDVIGLLEFWPRAKLMVRHAMGRIVDRERVYLPEAQIPVVVREARLLMAGYIALIAWAVIGQTWIPFLYFFIPRFAGAFGVYSFITTQHMGMAQNVYDHRLCTRSMTNSWLGRVLYWNMNYHIEHHVYPSIPFHALPALNERIRHQLPEPSSSLFGAHVEILKTVVAQRTDPSALAVRPLPKAHSANMGGAGS